MAQYQGAWGLPFDHRVSRAAAPVATATDPGGPFGGLDAMTFFHLPPSGIPLGWPPAGPPLTLAGTTAMTTGRMFNAIHMCLIPKGPHRGKVLVWNGDAVLAKAPAFVTLGPNDWMAFQAWAIVDPSPPTPTSIQFENYFLPIEQINSNVPGFVDQVAEPDGVPNLFCAGHAWTPYGDLVVAGGTRFSPTSGVLGGELTYVFNPAEFSAPFPGQTASLYAGAVGHWVQGPALEHGRWYPTVTQTARLPRVVALVPGGGEVMIAAGGTRQLNNPSPTFNHTWNSYEALRIFGPSAFNVHGLFKDSTGTPSAPIYVWPGPGTTTPAPLVEIDWLHEYARLHVLSTGRLFFSGYAERGAVLDHDNPGTWVKTIAQPAGYGTGYSSNWNHVRHDGSSVLLPNNGGLVDMVMRLCGSDEVPAPTNTALATATTEVSVAAGHWIANARLPATDGAPDGGRVFTNVVTLPTGALFLVGGENIEYTTTPPTPTVRSMYTPLLFVDGKWRIDAPNPARAVPRGYHATAVLLDDGRLLIGGGNTRNVDYEIYSPYYTLLPAGHKPTNVTFLAPTPFFDASYNAYRLNYGATYQMACTIGTAGVSLKKAVLIAPGSMTHHSDMHARYFELESTVTDINPNQIQITIPANENLAPRGFYMLWLVTDTDAVSDAMWVFLR